ncbi:polysaccharide deacetylase family protein [Mesorhizobium sp. VNQ89]|uniref:polysaccharide deacetylase family protein n=1 Tax=Mesorhizobium quangtriensis TaxID=3157709 RepID=UPI0032B87F96
MNAGLPATVAELARWRDAGLLLPVWWRDDDAIEPTPALDRLLALAERFSAPLHLAIVPQPATRELAERLQGTSDVFALTHGWKHANHAPADRKKAEFGAYRALSVMIEEITSGRERIRDLFGDKALPIFTPPWNRIADDIVGQLAPTGFKAISTYMPRSGRFAADGLLQVNTHLDPVAWKSGGGLLDPALLDAQMARELEARRTGSADNGEPYGLLTHHLVQDDATWVFTDRLLDMLAASSVARFTAPLDG